MAQHDYVIANASGATVRADINNMALAISSNNSGSSAPTTTYAYLWWLDTGNNLLKLRNSANNAWITMPFSVTANNTVDINGGTIDGTAIGSSSASTGVFTSVTASLASTISVTDNSDNLTLTSTDTDANSGPNLRLYRNSGTPADSDAIGLIEFEGRNDNTQDVVYAAIDTRIVDASDGTEDGRIEIASILAGTAGVSRMLMDATETVFNDNSKDLDFRVESDNDANALFLWGEYGHLGLGTTTPDKKLVVSDGGAQGIEISPAESGVSRLFSYNRSSNAYTPINIQGSDLRFGAGTSNAEKMRLTSDGELQLKGGTYLSSSGIESIAFSNSYFELADNSVLILTSILNTGALVAIGKNRSSSGITYDHCLVFAETGTATTMVANPSGRFGISSGTDTICNIYVSGSSLVIENKVGTTVQFCVAINRFLGL